jgi:hypothetical protein
MASVAAVRRQAGCGFNRQRVRLMEFILIITAFLAGFMVAERIHNGYWG